MIVMVIIRVKIVYIGVLMRLVSITPGHVKLDWLPPPKIDRSNENDRDNKNNGKDDGEDNGNNEDEGNKGNDNENEMKSYNESDSENDSNGNN